MSDDLSEISPWAYTLEPLREAVRLQLVRMYDSPVLPDTITVEVVLAAEVMPGIDHALLPDKVLDHVVHYPERVSRTRCSWEAVVEGWTGPRGDPWAECWTFAVAGNNL